jgi:hypothetical protein
MRASKAGFFFCRGLSLIREMIGVVISLVAGLEVGAIF